MSKAENRFKRGFTTQGQQFPKTAQYPPSKDPQDPNYRRLRFSRYADNFAPGFICPKPEAEAIKRQLATFLHEDLKLSLSDEMTLITHARSRVKSGNTERSFDQRSINARIGLRIPQTVILDKCARYMRNGKPMHRSELENESDFTIISTYQLEYRGIGVSGYRGIGVYYRLAYNLHTLSRLKWVMQQSLAKTLAHMHTSSVQKIYKKYQTEIEVERKQYKVFQVGIHRVAKKPLIATWGGITLTWNMQADLQNRPGWKWSGRSELEKQLLAHVCAVCKATHLTDQIEVHHIRPLNTLNTYDGREKPRCVKIINARKRKTLVLCRTCHDDLHAGRPFTRGHVSRSPTEEKFRSCWKTRCAQTRLSGLEKGFRNRAIS